MSSSRTAPANLRLRSTLVQFAIVDAPKSAPPALSRRQSRYSRGAAGIWIRDGELAFPVSEVTIASTLQEMLSGIVAIADDLLFRDSMESPTLMIREMTVGGR